MSAKEKLADFVRHAGEALGFEELEDTDLDLEVERIEEADYPVYCTDILREETNEVYRFCFIESPPTLGELIPFFFEQYRELEAESLDDYDGAVLFVAADSSEEDEDFWYVHRTETGEIGLFHSDYSLDEDEDGDSDDHLQNGKE